MSRGAQDKQRSVSRFNIDIRLSPPAAAAAVSLCILVPIVDAEIDAELLYGPKTARF